MAPRTTELLGMGFAHTTTASLLEHVFAALKRQQGGWIVTANLDILRRFVLDSDARSLYSGADICVADGMPIVWASRLAGDALPERVAGSSFAVSLAARAATEGRSLYLLGGDEGAAEQARVVLEGRHPTLQITGTSSPRVHSPPTAEELDSIVDAIGPDAPDILLVGLGSPKQEHLIRKLRERYPNAWMVGVGITFSFIAGHVQRAPSWMREWGLEWAHRLGQEPRRLAKRYLVDDPPFAVALFADALKRRVAPR